MSAIEKEQPGMVNQEGDQEKDNQDDDKKKRVYKDFGHEKDGPTSLYLCLPDFRRY